MHPIIVFILGIILSFSNIKNYNVIIVPEYHTDMGYHQKQLNVIKEYYRYNNKIIIAMEMFQQPFQTYIDRYINGEITEEEFLEKTEYKKRWGYNFKYYKDILNYAKENKIPVYALNIPNETLKEIREKGIENISSPYLPKPLPKYTDEEIKIIEEVLKEHKNIKDKKTFYDIQLAWDYSMAYKLYSLVKESRDKKVIVLIGKGHAKTIKRFLEKLDSKINVFIYD